MPTKAKVDLVETVIPDDDVYYVGVSYLRIGGPGELVIKGMSGDPKTFVVAAGEYVPFTRPGFVMEATTATDILVFE